MTPSGPDPARPVQLWGGRFSGEPAEALSALSVSTHFDWRLAGHDLAGSAAHARALHAAGLLTAEELATMLAALDGLAADVRSGAFVPGPADEDVHTALERGLLERAGTGAGRPAAGRALAQRPDRDVDPDVPARAGQAAEHAGGGARRRPDRAGRSAPRGGHARPHPPAARPAHPAVASPAGALLAAAAHAGSAARLGRPGGGQPVRLRCAGRQFARPGSAGDRDRTGLRPRPWTTPSTPPPPATWWPSSPS